MYRLLTLLVIFSLGACGKPTLPDKDILVQITRDGRCLVAGQQMQCDTLGQDLTAKYPTNSLTITIDADKKADYLVLASVLNSIRLAGIERTLFVNHE